MYSDDPNMSDATLLVSVEDLISRAMGPPDANFVNFKLIQMILQILARQQRMLKQRVEIKVTELAAAPPTHKTFRGKSPEESTESSSSKSPRPPAKRRMTEIKEELEKGEKPASIKQKIKEEEKEKERAEKIKLKEKERAEKMIQKEQEKADKLAQREQEKAGKIAQKEHEKAEKAAQKGQEKAGKIAQKEQEKAGKIVQKEQEKADKAQKGREKEEKKDQMEKEKAKMQELKEKERTEKMLEKEKEKNLIEPGKLQKEAEKADRVAQKEKKRSNKEQEMAEKEKSRAEREEEREDVRDASLSITEALRGKENVIVVEKGPTTRTDSRSRTNIDVVTQSQFALLETAVKQLKEVAVPKPLAMPDNQKLRSDLAKGTASLPDTMQAMQVGARVKAAEAAIERMTGLLTQLAAAGALPEDLTDQVERVAEEDMPPVSGIEPPSKSRASIAPRKSVLIDPKVSELIRLDARPSASSRLEGRPSAASSVAIPRPSQVSVPRPSILSRTSTAAMGPGVTQEEMNSALRELREEMSKSLQGVVSRAAAAADSALHTAMNVANKLDVALKLDVRISSLFALVSDYAEQLSGFDAGLTTQMQSFKDQIGQMRTDLESGLAQLENVNNNAETAAVMELTERYTELVGELDTTLTAHNALQMLQGQLGDEMHSLVECVEMLREQKCDKDEVLDGLRDKADISRLAGLLSEVQFASARADFERRLDLCHDKFRRQDAMWTMAIKDLSRLTDQKAELIELLSLRDLAQRQLQDLHDRLRALALALGEPKAALLTRQMSLGASCGACGAAALMEPQDADAGAPPRLPPLRAGPEPESCVRWVTAEPPLDRHTCHRWVGGSHTLVAAGDAAGRPRGVFSSAGASHRARAYTGYGSDGRLYMMEEDLQPCIECNPSNAGDRPPEPGAGDNAGDRPPEPGLGDNAGDCRPEPRAGGGE